ncbi:MAG: TM2 domain-containing protein [Bacteroidales bacterium]|jgi:TM2 domain-containing membrane protein YozV
MYCRNCGNEVSEKAVMCVACGTPPLAGNRYCPNCKAETSPDAGICIRCGVGLINTSNHSEFDWLTTLLLCLFLGTFGIHRFYTKSIGIGIVQLLTLGGCGLWTLIDFILIVVGNFRDGNGKVVVNKQRP